MLSTRYDPAALHTAAAELHSLSATIVRSYVGVSITVGGLITFCIFPASYEVRFAMSFLASIGFGFIGMHAGRVRRAQLLGQVQLLMCQQQIELNTRDRAMTSVV